MMTAPQVEAFLGQHFPQSRAFGARIESVSEGSVRVRMTAEERHLRPGDTVSGPTLFTLCDHAFYCLVLSAVGPVPLAVTTHLTIDFLRRPDPGELVAEAEILKLGRRLVVARVTVTHPGSSTALCHATGTYSLPPD